MEFLKSTQFQEKFGKNFKMGITSLGVS
jgi:hypothetical protein